MTTLAHNYIKKSHQSKPHCPCGSLLTNQTDKAAYDAYLLKNDIQRDKTIIRSLDTWFKGGNKPYIERGKDEK